MNWKDFDGSVILILSRAKADGRTLKRIAISNKITFFILRSSVNLLGAQTLRGEGALDETALIELLDEPAVDQVFDVDVADARVLRFQKPLHVAHALQRRVRLARERAHGLVISFFGGQGFLKAHFLDDQV